MASRTMPAIVGITICFFLVCTVNTTEMTTTQNHSKTSESLTVGTSTTAETSLSTAIDVINTTLSYNTTITSTAIDVINTTLSYNTTIKLNGSEGSQFSTATTTSTTQSTVKVSTLSTLKATTPLSSQSSSTAPPTGQSATTEKEIYSTKTSAVTQVISTFLTQSIPTPVYNETGTTANINASTKVSDTENHDMKISEIILTSIFSSILVVVVLVIVSFGFKRCLRGRFQYSHQPLREISYEADRYSAPDDTLVISGGLYDAPRIYNPNMTVLEEEEPQNDYASFNSRPGQFRLEFLPGDKDVDPVFNGSQRRNV